jgi:gamma-glutamylcysteine synthetase
MEWAVQAEIEELALRFERAFPARLDSTRTIGREAEYPVITAEGTAATMDQIWPLLLAGCDLHPKFDAVNPALIVALEGTDYSYALEVGRGTIEISSRPCTHLFELEEIHQAALRRLVDAADQLQWRVLGYGMQPVSPPEYGLLSPKQRYQALFTIMGDEWLWYTVTAAEQLHVDVARPEAVRLLNFGLSMAPVIVALCGNSPIYAGKESGFCTAREGILTQQSDYAARHGMPGRPYTGFIDLVAQLSQLPFILRREGAYLLPDGRPFVEVLHAQEADFDAFLLHDHYIWHSARLRVAHATLELRPACQQPPGEQMAAAALYLGLIEAVDPIEEMIESVSESRGWEVMQAYHRRALVEGLAAHEPAPEFLAKILHFSQDALQRRGYGEEQLLAPLWQRLHARENPAQQALRRYREAGIAALINSVTITNESL